MYKKTTLGLLALFVSMAANAGLITVSTNPADFNLSLEAFPTVVLGTNANIVSTSGNIELDNSNVGDPTTGTHGYQDWAGSILPGTEYVLNGDENFDIIFSSLQLAFAMDYEDDSIDSVFDLTFFNGAINVGSSSFTSIAPFNTSKFIGFISDMSFDKVEVRETDGVKGENSNEYFQFYTATAAVPEPGTIALFGLGLVGIGFARRKRA